MHLESVAVPLVKSVGPWNLLGTVCLAAVGWYAGTRVWRGLPIVPSNSLESENRMAVLSVTALPSAVLFTAWLVIELIGELDSVVHNSVLRVILVSVQLVMVVVSLVAFVVATSLFFLTKPRRFVPPHLRSP